MGLGVTASYDWGAGPDADALWAVAVLVELLGATAIGVVLGLTAAGIRRRRAR